ncbi:hypothetical protein ACHAPT_002281, partial [Fusarium lateritium]
MMLHHGQSYSPGIERLNQASSGVDEDIEFAQGKIDDNQDLPWPSAVREFNEGTADKEAGEELKSKLDVIQEPTTRIIGHVLFAPKI